MTMTSPAPQVPRPLPPPRRIVAAAVVARRSRLIAPPGWSASPCGGSACASRRPARWTRTSASGWAWAARREPSGVTGSPSSTTRAISRRCSSASASSTPHRDSRSWGRESPARTARSCRWRPGWSSRPNSAASCRSRASVLAPVSEPAGRARRRAGLPHPHAATRRLHVLGGRRRVHGRRREAPLGDRVPARGVRPAAGAVRKAALQGAGSGPGGRLTVFSGREVLVGPT